MSDRTEGGDAMGRPTVTRVVQACGEESGGMVTLETRLGCGHDGVFKQVWTGHANPIHRGVEGPDSKMAKNGLFTWLGLQSFMTGARPTNPAPSLPPPWTSAHAT